MSQVHVERIIGLLVTDEGLRRQFTENPGATIKKLVESGLELNWCERKSLSRLDPQELARFAQVIDGRLQKVDFERGDT